MQQKSHTTATLKFLLRIPSTINSSICKTSQTEYFLFSNMSGGFTWQTHCIALIYLGAVFTVGMDTATTVSFTFCLQCILAFPPFSSLTGWAYWRNGSMWQMKKNKKTNDREITTVLSIFTQLLFCVSSQCSFHMLLKCVQPNTVQHYPKYAATPHPPFLSPPSQVGEGARL